MIDNSILETAAGEFVKDKSKESFVKVMELLEKAVLYLPAMELPKDAKIMPCLLRKDNGEQAIPVFTSKEHIPEERKFPALLTMPYFTCVAMAIANKEKVQAIVLNPFTQNITVPQQMLEVAHKRAQIAGPKTVKLTEKQFHQLANKRVAQELLPVFLYEKQKEGLMQMQEGEGKFLLSLYASIYPKEVKVPYSEDDFSFMTLNVTETMQITRIDMPEKNLADGLCRRLYVVWKTDREELLYYTIEKTPEGNVISRIYADRKHEVVEKAPDNGAEIETIMNLAG
ncbi:MAG: SseB family protein [Roseburia sp.]|nr:SseB family protein [Roseburia sp.]MCM1243723.1 SseB family protein [Roseburia sp.]